MDWEPSGFSVTASLEDVRQRPETKPDREGRPGAYSDRSPPGILQRNVLIINLN